jgi:monomeric phenylalanine-4-hydroxylase
MTTRAQRVTQESQHPLVLDPKHPGVGDVAYVQRRRELYDLARNARLANTGIPNVAYTPEEHHIWHTISQRLVEAHKTYACALYLKGKSLLNIDTEHMPQLAALNARMEKASGFGLVPAEGLLDAPTFFGYLSQRRMPVTQFLRHNAHPEFTPEPDAVHDVIGHVPCLMDKAYTDVVRLVGEGVRGVSNEAQLTAWIRMYWFTIEFGLIEEAGELKVFGAGLLSSLEEMEHCLSDKVERRRFDLETVIKTAYDTTQMQSTVFVLPSLGALKDATYRLMTKFAA